MATEFYTKGIYASGMILQQNTVNCIFGRTEAGAEVTLKFREVTVSSNADAAGNWRIEYNPGAAGGPFDLTIYSVGKRILFTDVFVGEVWLLSGQSNAQLPMERMKFSYADEFSLPENPALRMLTVPISYAFDDEKDDIAGDEWSEASDGTLTLEKTQKKWLAASPATIGGMSGTGYFFGKKLNSELKIPVGIINASQGGSPISAWMNRESLECFPHLNYLPRLDKWMDRSAIDKALSEASAKQKAWDENINLCDKGNNAHWESLSLCDLDASWTSFSVPGNFDGLKKAGLVWFKKEFELTEAQADALNSDGGWLWLGTIVDADKAWINGAFCGVTYYLYPPRRYEIPKGVLKAGKNTVTLRVQKNSFSPLRFYEEKPYCIFSKKDFVPPVAFRNVENQNEKISAVKIDLTGDWRMKVSCEVDPAPASCFLEWEPTALYNAMLSPCFNYAVSGAVWYQGESDAGIPGDYRKLLVQMIELWRRKFIYADKELPFVIMQLPNWADGWKSKARRYTDSRFGDDFELIDDYDKHSLNFDDWPAIRADQAAAAEIAGNAGFAVTIDAGEWNDLHPEKKRTCGTRAAMEALRLAYKRNLPRAPEAEMCSSDSQKITIRFNCFGSGLAAFDCTNGFADFSTPTDDVRGFVLILKDGTGVIPKARLVDSNHVEVRIPKGKKLSELRFLWESNPDAVNLYNKDLLPAVPFKLSL